jgi:surface antigen
MLNLNRFGRKTMISLAAGSVLVVLALTYGFLSWRQSVNNRTQYDTVVTGVHRSGADTRGLVDHMIDYRNEFVPAFLPQHVWSLEMCSAAVITAVNFTTGARTLKDGPAWKFRTTNEGRIEPLYDRSDDFAFDTSDPEMPRLVEKFDRAISLTALLRSKMQNGTTDRLIVVGYHFSHTHSDRKLFAAQKEGGTLNSHLMLLLGKRDGRWYGYHMLHSDPDEDFPFKIASLGEDMPENFDLIYLWEVKGMVMPSKGSAIAFAQELQPYASVQNKVTSLASAYVFGDTDQFPRIQHEVDGVIPIAQKHSGYRKGQLLGFVGNTAVRHHRGSTPDKERGDYGLTGQCVELANRYLVETWGFKNLTRHGDADSYFYDTRSKGLTSHKNGSSVKPRVGDLIVFDKGPTDGNPGHVAIVSAVTDKSVCVAQQNIGPWHMCLDMTHDGDSWHVEELNDDLPCTGWSSMPHASSCTVEEPCSESMAPTPKEPIRATTMLTTVTVNKKGLQQTVRAHVARTEGANLEATFACNGWDFSAEATHKVYPKQVYKVCGWYPINLTTTE